jgi:hypothetical protein
VGADTGYSIAVDASGNSYVTGSFEGRAFATTNLTSQGLSDIFLAVKPEWFPAMGAAAGGTNADAGFGIAVDLQGNCYVTGYFNEKAEFSGTNLDDWRL